jgi:hypothetical protein
MLNLEILRLGGGEVSAGLRLMTASCYDKQEAGLAPPFWAIALYDVDPGL